MAEDKTIPVWGVSATGEVVVREGVRGEGEGLGQNGPVGERWCLVPAECPMSSVCGGIGASSVWAVSRDGRAHLRLGVTPTNPKVSTCTHTQSMHTNFCKGCQFLYHNEYYLTTKPYLWLRTILYLVLYL